MIYIGVTVDTRSFDYFLIGKAVLPDLDFL